MTWSTRGRSVHGRRHAWAESSVDDSRPQGALAEGITAARFRHVLGHFCSGLTIVTATTDDGSPVGFTCQSFASLSLEPPMVLLSASRGSMTWSVIREVGRFCVNILAAGASATSDQFAKSGEDKFRGVRWEPSTNGSPRLADAIAWIDCELRTEHDGGDHFIAIGAVTQLAAESGPQPGPLLFYRGSYRNLAAPNPPLRLVDER